MLAVTTVATVSFSGVAWAATLFCNANAITCRGTNDNDSIGGSPVYDDIYARSGNDTVYGEGGGSIDGGPGDDDLVGNSGNDTFELADNNAGNDNYWGDDGSDTIWAGPGRDHVSGRAGNDSIDAQGYAIARDPVRDTVNCGPGRDTVYYNTGRGRSAPDFIYSNCERKLPD